MNKWKWVVLTVLPLFITTGCWDKRDPEDREYMITMGVDKKDDGYIISFAPAKTEEKEPKKMVCEGKTLADAIACNDSRNSRKTELGQLWKRITARDYSYGTFLRILPKRWG